MTGLSTLGIIRIMKMVMNSLKQTLFAFKPLSKQLNFFKGVYVFGWALFAFYFGITMPLYYWDVIGYVASAYELSGLSGNTLRDSTYDDVRNAVPPHTFLEFTSGNYGATVYEDASSLQQQLPFYKIRYVYVGVTYVIGQLIGSFSQATVLISAVSGFLIVSISGILFWNVKSAIAFLSVPPAVLLGGALKLSRLTEPDAITALATIFLCTLILIRKHIVAALLIGSLPLFRTDYLIFALVASLILLLRGNSRLAMLSAFFALLTYFAINHFTQNYGYITIFNFTLINFWHPYPLSMPISDNVLDYVRAYTRGISNLINQPGIFLYPIIYTTALIFTIPAQSRYQNRFFIIYFSCLCFAVVHFLLFPAALSRHYFILSWASLMYLAEAFALSRYPARGVSNYQNDYHLKQ